MIATTGPWIALGALLIAGGAGLFVLLAMGRLSLDLGWGRSFHELGPITVRVAAPRQQLIEMISAPYLSTRPARSGIEVLARGEGLVVATHHTKVRPARSS